MVQVTMASFVSSTDFLLFLLVVKAGKALKTNACPPVAPGLLQFLAGIECPSPIFLAFIHLISKSRVKPLTSGTVF